MGFAQTEPWNNRIFLDSFEKKIFKNKEHKRKPLIHSNRVVGDVACFLFLQKGQSMTLSVNLCWFANIYLKHKKLLLYVWGIKYMGHIA